MKKKARAGMLAILGLGIACQIVSWIYRLSYAERPSRAVLQVLPTHIRGWASKALPLAESDAGVERVLGIMNYDDVYYREFSAPGRRFTVYAAYWGEGKMPADQVAVHTPQYCWIAAGWTCLGENVPWRNELARQPCWPVQERVFVSSGGQRQYVLLWHLVAGRPYVGRASAGFRSDVAEYYHKPWKFFQASRGDQLLVRISGDQSFANVEIDSESLVSDLLHLGLSNVKGKKRHD